MDGWSWRGHGWSRRTRRQDRWERSGHGWARRSRLASRRSERRWSRLVCVAGGHGWSLGGGQPVICLRSALSLWHRPGSLRGRHASRGLSRVDRGARRCASSPELLRPARRGRGCLGRDLRGHRTRSRALKAAALAPSPPRPQPPAPRNVGRVVIKVHEWRSWRPSVGRAGACGAPQTTRNRRATGLPRRAGADAYEPQR